MSSVVLTSLLFFGFVGVTIVVYSLSPYFGALGLVLLSLCVCGLLGYLGFSFLGLMILLTYLGGMMVVFIYSSALASDKYPKVGGWGGAIITFFFLITFFLLKEGFLTLSSLVFDNINSGFVYKEGWLLTSFLEKGDWGVCGLLYGFYFFLLFIVGLALMVALIFVLVMTFGSYKKNLRSLGS